MKSEVKVRATALPMKTIVNTRLRWKSEVEEQSKRVDEKRVERLMGDVRKSVDFGIVLTDTDKRGIQ